MNIFKQLPKVRGWNFKAFKISEKMPPANPRVWFCAGIDRHVIGEGRTTERQSLPVQMWSNMIWNLDLKVPPDVPVSMGKTLNGTTRTFATKKVHIWLLQLVVRLLRRSRIEGCQQAVLPFLLLFFLCVNILRRPYPIFLHLCVPLQGSQPVLLCIVKHHLGKQSWHAIISENHFPPLFPRSTPPPSQGQYLYRRKLAVEVGL